MNNYLYTLLLLCLAVTTQAQERPAGGGRDKGKFSLSNLSATPKEIPDSLMQTDSTELKARRLTGYHLTPFLGEPYVAPMDTNRLNISNSTLVESKSLAVGYQSTLGSAAQSRIFFDRKEARDFIFADPYDYYITTPENAYFYDTKAPYTHILYNSSGGNQSKDEQLKGVLTINFGKRLNVGADIDYIYSRGHYESSGNKLLSYRLFGSYRTDRYSAFAFLSNHNFLNMENGGLTDDRYVTTPDDIANGRQTTDTKAFPVRYTNTWNRVRGKYYFLTHRYNLGFERELDKADEEGNAQTEFIPVSSIIHTFEYKDNSRHFGSNDAGIDTCYTNIYQASPTVEDRTSYWSVSNTLGLSLREGFQDWVKFGLTAYVNIEKRRFQLPSAVGSIDGPFGPQPIVSPVMNDLYDEFSTFVGAELSKKQGNLFTFNVRGELGLVGDDVGEVRANGELQSRFTLFKKEATVKANAYIKNINPAFYTRHNHSRYFWWDNNFGKMQQIYAGASVRMESTRTELSAGVESIQNHVFFNHKGLPEQFNGNLQVVSARLKQDLMYKAFGWENEVAYQVSSNTDVLPLPQLSLYSNIYLAFKVAKVLTFQIGANAYFHTSYNAPYYEPATQQFQVQSPDKAVKVGNYPLINGYANLHLKQARFFLMAYNLGELFVKPNYFSLPHYPLSPMVLKMGIAVVFNN